MKNKNKKNQLLFIKSTLTELTLDSLRNINGGIEFVEEPGTTNPKTTSITSNSSRPTKFNY